MAIPVVLLFYARRRKNLPFKHLFWLFGLFIAACGTTHLMGYITTISPVYRLDGLIKLITALASWGTVVAIAAISPKALAMRMPEELETEIAARERAQEDLALINASLRKRTAELEAANAELEGFTYVISHDLKAPLRGIVANSRMALEDSGDKLDESLRHYLQRMDVAALKMASLVEDLLQFTRLGRQDVNRSDVDLSAIALGVVEELKGIYEAAFDVEEGLVVKGDPQLLRIVLYNLLENACKYSSRERSPRVQVLREETAYGSAIVVRDNGVGFDMAHAVKVFLPFERLHADDSVEGTGIGLANVKRIIDRHGGHIWAESALGAGAAFFFTLGEGTAEAVA